MFCHGTADRWPKTILYLAEKDCEYAEINYAYVIVQGIYYFKLTEQILNTKKLYNTSWTKKSNHLFIIIIPAYICPAAGHRPSLRVREHGS